MTPRVLSDVVAERLVQLRKEARLSREEFAERCRQLGATDFTAAALTNIETGRRDSNGRRRRKITVDEALMFAEAVGVSPMRLLADPRSDGQVPILVNAVNNSGLLTDDEHRAMALTAELWNLLTGSVIGDGPSRDGDTSELCAHIHAIQRMVLAQAAARAYPDRYRLLGQVLGTAHPCQPTNIST